MLLNPSCYSARLLIVKCTRILKCLPSRQRVNASTRPVYVSMASVFLRHCSCAQPLPLLYSPLDQSNLVVRTVYCLWPFSGNVKPLSGSIWTRTATTCNVYGRFSALFGRPFCIPLSANQILSAPTCISYGRFSALFRHPSLIFNGMPPFY